MPKPIEGTLSSGKRCSPCLGPTLAYEFTKAVGRVGQPDDLVLGGLRRRDVGYEELLQPGESYTKLCVVACASQTPLSDGRSSDTSSLVCWSEASSDREDEADACGSTLHMRCDEVRNGGGAGKGWDHETHCSWACHQLHPLQPNPPRVPQSVADAVRYECFTDPAEIDAMRDAETDLWLRKAEELQGAQMALTAQAPDVWQPIVGRLHVPFVDWLCKRLDYPDVNLPNWLFLGFQFLGELESCGVGADPVEDDGWRPSIDELWQNRAHTNREVVGSLRSSEFEQDVHNDTLDDAKTGFMAYPVAVPEEHSNER